jgi:hypothetical protein
MKKQQEQIADFSNSFMHYFSFRKIFQEQKKYICIIINGLKNISENFIKSLKKNIEKFCRFTKSL